MTTITATLALLASIFGGALVWALKALGKKDEKIGQMAEQEKRRKAGENAAAKERDETDGLDDDAIRDRLRERGRIRRGL